MIRLFNGDFFRKISLTAVVGLFALVVLSESRLPAQTSPAGAMPPAMNQEPSATPVPLCDIVGPWEIGGFSVEMVLGAVLFIIIVGVLLAWRFGAFRIRKPLLPQEIALRDLEALKNFEGTPYEMAIRVSDVLRRYIRDQYGINATNQTSIEFLHSMRANVVFSAEEKSP